MEANQASLSTARIRGFARRAASIASTGQRNQKSRTEAHKSCKDGDRVRVNCLRCLPLYFPNEDNRVAAMGRSKDLEHCCY